MVLNTQSPQPTIEVSTNKIKNLFKLSDSSIAQVEPYDGSERIPLYDIRFIDDLYEYTNAGDREKVVKELNQELQELVQSKMDKALLDREFFMGKLLVSRRDYDSLPLDKESKALLRLEILRSFKLVRNLTFTYEGLLWCYQLSQQILDKIRLGIGIQDITTTYAYANEWHSYIRSHRDGNC